ncbi:hypothetical protein A9F13_27g00462 [Clavispora lusitaniae]|uniref:Uncharacterized protein n=1 Tax=Clavispora lusitaniae TaxID=36911 RepID=A0AA91SZI2_CLALS|nr:hypothetical protein A9F13_27g00462 [Clavispora lusitaniae]
MVIRSTIYAAVSFLPYSDRIPSPIINILKEEKPTEEEEPQTPEKLPEPLSPREKIHNRLLDRRSQRSERSVYDSGSLTLAENDTSNSPVPLRRSILSEKTDSDIVMQKYLEDQNSKFDELINKNLDVVLEQQNKFEEEAHWKSLVMDLTKCALSSDPTSTMPGALLRAVKHAWPFKMGATEDSFDSATRERQIRLEQMLDSMDYRTKVELLRNLYVDLGISEQKDVSQLSHLHRPEDPDTLLAKIELLSILSVRLAFIAIRYFIPATKSLYAKFKTDELLLFNSKNLDRLMTRMIKTLEMVEGKLSDSDAKSALSERSKGIQPGDNTSSPKASEEMRRGESNSRNNKISDAGRPPSLLEVAQQFAHEME